MYKIERPNTWKLIKPKMLGRERPFIRREGVALGELVVIEFYTREQLINYIAQYNNYVGTEFFNDILDNVGVNDNDMKNVYHWPTAVSASYRTMEPRRCRVIDPYGNNIYSGEFVREVRNHIYSEKLRMEWYAQHREHITTNQYRWSRWSLPDKYYPEFRRGPVPFVHKRHGWHVYRHVKTFQAIREVNNPEYKEFSRKKFSNNLVTIWDDPIRDWRDKGWKSQGKRRHQWENGAITRAKHEIGKHHDVVKVKSKKEMWKQLEDWKQWENSEGWGNWNSWDAWNSENNWEDITNGNEWDDMAV